MKCLWQTWFIWISSIFAYFATDVSFLSISGVLVPIHINITTRQSWRASVLNVSPLYRRPLAIFSCVYRTFTKHITHVIIFLDFNFDNDNDSMYICISISIARTVYTFGTCTNFYVRNNLIFSSSGLPKTSIEHSGYVLQRPVNINMNSRKSSNVGDKIRPEILIGITSL